MRAVIQILAAEGRSPRDGMKTVYGAYSCWHIAVVQGMLTNDSSRPGYARVASYENVRQLQTALRKNRRIEVRELC